MERIKILTDFLLRLRKSTGMINVEQQNKEALAEANSVEMAIAQQNLLALGVDPEDLFKMWGRNKNILPDQAAKIRAELPSNHILRKILAEHEMMLCFLADLEEMNEDIQKLDEGSSLTLEIREIGHLLSHLMLAEPHREMEEQILFPELDKRGYFGPSRVVTHHHNRLRLVNLKLIEIVMQVDEIRFDHFKIQIDQLISYFVPEFRKHIFIENNILFPLALEFINDKKTWDRIKALSTEIGYCSFCHTSI